MKIPYKHLVKHISENPDLEELSSKLFQLVMSMRFQTEYLILNLHLIEETACHLKAY